MLCIYDEAVGEGALPLFSDSVISLVRQWTLHSALWKLLAGAFISGSLVLACGYSMTSSFERALRRGNPGHDAEAKRRLLSEQRRKGLLDTAFAAQAAGIPSETAADSKWEPPAASEAVSGIVAAFEKHPVVMIGEVHWLRQAGDFYIRLVRDAGFQQKVQDIVVEFASRNNQPLLDKYLGGEDLPIEDVRHIWRDTTKVASGNRQSTPNGLPPFAKSTAGCRRRGDCACLQVTPRLIGTGYTLTPSGRRLVTTTFRLQMLSRSKSWEKSVTRWSSWEPIM